MSKYAHVVKLAGQLINDDFIKTICSHHRHYFGVGVAKDDTIMLQHVAEKPDFEVLSKVQETFKDSACVFAFGDVAHTLPEDMQPFSILKDADGNPVCIVCLDGDFERHRKGNESHIPEYFVARNNLEKRIAKLASLGIDGIIKELNDDLTKQDICNLWGERGCITFMFSDGQICTITSDNNTVKGQYDWGFASNAYGYKTGGTTSKATSVVASAADVLKNLVTGHKPADVTPQNGTVVAAATQPTKTETTTDEPLHPDAVLVKPDFRHYDTRRKQKGWYEERLGYEPQRFKDAPPLIRIPAANGQYTWKMADTKSLGILSQKMIWDPPRDAATKVTVTASETQPQQPEKPVEPVQQPQPQADPNVPAWLQSKKPKEVGGQQSKTAAVALPAGGNDQAKTSVPASVSTAREPVIPPDQIQKVQEIMKKTDFVGVFGENMKQIIDPKLLKKQVENTLPDFAKRFALGNDMSVFDGWEYEQFWKFTTELMATGKPDVIAKLMFDLRNYALSQKLNLLTNPNYKPTKQAM